MAPFTQDRWAGRCEWGPTAVIALAPADVIVVVDVFSFTTCVDVAVSRDVAGRELAERGHQRDHEIAGELDVSRCVPRFDGLAFVRG